MLRARTPLITNPPTMQRVRIFVDFWSFHLSVQKLSRLSISVDWKVLGRNAARALRSVIDETFRCEGIYIYGSYTTSAKWQVELAKDMLDKKAPEIYRQRDLPLRRTTAAWS